MLGEKIEFYDEQLSMFSIAKKIGITRDTLEKYYEQTGNIYEAEKICRKILEEKQSSLVEYEGEMLAIQTIAKKTGIKDSKTLKKYYEQTGNIYKAIEKCNESKIEYNGEKLTIDAIAKKEGLKSDTLKRHYKKTQDIYSAVEYCLEIRKKAETEKIEYKGEKRTKTSVAKELRISKNAFIKYYEQAKTVEGAVELYKASINNIEDKKILYKGEFKFVKSIAREEKIAETTLTRYLEKYDTVEKAVFMAKIQRQKSQKVKVKNNDVNLYDLSIILGIKYTELINMVNKGMPIEEIKSQNQIHQKRNKLKQEYIKSPNGQSLLDYCVEHKLNYSFIYRAINTYDKTLEEAVKEYQNNGLNMPKKWVFEKYGVLLRHLMTENSVDVQRVVDYMRKEQISMSEAIEKYIIRKNARQNKMDADWIQEVYAVLTDKNMANEYDEFKKEFFINDGEEECVIKSYDEVQKAERKLLLFEILEVIKEESFSQEEISELLQIYQILPQEIETIFLDLDRKYEKGIMLGENEPLSKKRNTINEIARKWHYLTGEEREKILKDNEISSYEENRITDLSNNMIKYKNMLTNTKQEKSLEGENHD